MRPLPLLVAPALRAQAEGRDMVPAVPETRHDEDEKRRREGAWLEVWTTAGFSIVLVYEISWGFLMVLDG